MFYSPSEDGRCSAIQEILRLLYGNRKFITLYNKCILTLNIYAKWQRTHLENTCRPTVPLYLLL